MHNMKTDLETGIIEVEIIGFWDMEAFAAFARDRSEQVRAVAAARLHHMLLIDYSQAMIQAQDVVAALTDLARNAERQSRRIALFSSGPLARLQAKRIASVRDDIAIFDTRAEALGWLTELVETPRLRAMG